MSKGTFRAVADADGWRCWLCGDEVRRDVTAGPWAGTVDHVTPRRRRGPSTVANLRLAHSTCNGRRGARDPEVAWPPELGVVESADLYRLALAAAESAAAGGAGATVVGLVPPDAEFEAASWLVQRISAMFRGEWDCLREARGEFVALELRCLEAPSVIPRTR